MTHEPVPPSDSSGDGTGLPTNHKAVYSLIFGVAAFVCLYVFTFGAFALGLPSITCGIHARREIAASRGNEAGDGTAVIGLIIGTAAVIFAILSFGIDAVFGD